MVVRVVLPECILAVSINIVLFHKPQKMLVSPHPTPPPNTPHILNMTHPQTSLMRKK